MGYPTTSFSCIVPPINHQKGGDTLEEEIRKKAMERYIQGESPKSIYTELKCSKKWFFKWLGRYQTGHKHWYKDRPRRPHTSPSRISQIDRERIIATRKRLESESFAQTGTSAIKWELSKSGLGLPSDRTINRVLNEEDLVKKRLPMFPKALSIPISPRPWILTTFIRPISSAPGTLKAMENFTPSM